MKNRVRTIVVDDLELCWTRRADADGQAERVRVWLPANRRFHLEVRFVESERCHPTIGQGWGGHEGGVLLHGELINLNLPSTIERLIRAALDQGWSPEVQKSNLLLDGVELLTTRG